MGIGIVLMSLICAVIGGFILLVFGVEFAQVIRVGLAFGILMIFIIGIMVYKKPGKPLR